MQDLTDIYTSDAQSDEDAELVAAGQVLQKIAEEQNVNLNDLSDDDVADLLTMLRGGEVSGKNDGSETQKEASATMSDEQTTDTVTMADVAVELAKVAQANNINLDEISREEYHEAFESLAQQMNDPSYFEKKAELQEKVAEADTIGRQMARSFMDELDGEGEKVAEGRHGYAPGAKLRSPSLKERGEKLYESAKEKVHGAGKALKGEYKKDKAALKKGGKAVAAFAKRHPGKLSLAAAGAAGAGGYAMSKKSSLEDEATELAQALIEGENLQKSASDDDAVVNRAIEILRENGYEV